VEEDSIDLLNGNRREALHIPINLSINKKDETKQGKLDDEV